MIDVVLATHNGARYLPDLLDSLLRQAVTPARLIAVDDGSTDTTYDQLIDFATRADFEVEITSTDHNLGSAAAFGLGVALTRSRVIAFCDQDDRWHPNKLGRLEAEWTRAESAAMVVSDALLTNDTLQPLGKTFWEAIGFDPPTASASRRDVFNSLMRGGRIPGMTMTMTRDLALSAGPPASGWHHDGWYALIAASVGVVRFVREPLVDYRLHAGQQTAPGHAAPNRVPPVERARRFSAGAVRFLELANRLADLPADDWAVEAVREKGVFLQARADLALLRTERPFRVFSALQSGHYRRYASRRSALADLIGVSRPRPYVG